MDNVLILKPLPMVCECDPEGGYCDKCRHMRCDYCGSIGVRKAQTFDWSGISKTIIFYECGQKRCQNHAADDFDMGKEMAKGIY